MNKALIIYESWINIILYVFLSILHPLFLYDLLIIECFTKMSILLLLIQIILSTTIYFYIISELVILDRLLLFDVARFIARTCIISI